MKKIILLFMLLATINLNAQKPSLLTLVTKILDNSNGVITKSKQSDSVLYMILADLPSYESFDLFSLSCKSVLLEYNNVKIVKSWTRTKEGDITSLYLVNNRKLIIMYFIDAKIPRAGFLFELE